MLGLEGAVEHAKGAHGGSCVVGCGGAGGESEGVERDGALGVGERDRGEGGGWREIGGGCGCELWRGRGRG